MNQQLMEGRILSEVLVAGKVNIFELARRVRIGHEGEYTKHDSRLFIETLRHMLSDKKLLMNYQHEIMVSNNGQHHFTGRT